jgi:hypothetical protein
MSPFYRKEGETWVSLMGPIDIHVGRHQGDLVKVFPQKDPEQIRIAIQGDLIVRDEDGAVYYPGQHDLDDNHFLINRRDVFIENTRSGDRKAIIHSEKPIGKK